MAVDVTENLWIGLSDGTRLAARLWLPETARSVPVPAILEYVPYRKRDGTRGRDEPMHHWFAEQGYAAIRVDLRGSGESDGLLDDEYLRSEQDDAVEVIAWIAAQSWCDGAIGMMGKSWGGFNALQVAARRPPALKAVITVCSTDDRYADDVHYMGGCLLNDNHWWGAIMLAYQGRPPDPEIMGEDWRRAWLDRLDHMPFWPALWLKYQRRDAYWRHGSICEDWSAIQCPVFAVGGWADAYTNAVPRMLEHLTVPRLGLIGPWAHLYPQSGSPAPAIGFLQEAKRWWDKWLRGVETGIMDEPMLRAYVQDWTEPATSLGAAPGRWVGERLWPSPRIEMRALHLAPTGLRVEAPTVSSLSIASPAWVGIGAGEWMGTGVAGEMPADQRIDDGGSLVFDTPPLAEPLTLLGSASVELELTTDAPLGQIAVRLCDVAPDGASLRVAYGLLNLTHRDGAADPAPMRPGQPTPLRVVLKVCGYRFPAGHRLRLALSTGYWPIIWPAPARPTITILTGTSRLVLPVRPDDPADTAIGFAPPLHGPAAPTTQVAPGRISRSVAIDLQDDLVRYTTKGEGGLFGEGVLRFDEIGTTVGHSLERNLTLGLDDPLSARSVIEQRYEMGRDGWRITIETRTELSGDATHFHMRGELAACENGTLVRRRQWDERIVRDHL